MLASYVPHHIRALGISNVTLPVLCGLYYACGDVKPSVVQLRFTAETGYASEVRSWCAGRGIVFQAHKVLKENERLAESEVVGVFTKGVAIGREVALYLLVVGLREDVWVLSGPKSEQHLSEDVEAWKQRIIGNRDDVTWKRWMWSFRQLLDGGTENA